MIDSERTDIITKKFVSGGQIFVQPRTREDRTQLIAHLESKGFCCVENQSYTRQGTIESRFPLVIELNSKSIWHLSNVTCSAAVASSGLIISDKDFYLLYSLHLQTE